MDTPRGYIICATPRTGSTLLCRLVASTGVLGRPESFFREPDEASWALRFNLRTVGPRVEDYRDFVRAVRDAGTTPNGVFGARIMWGSVGRIRRGLKAPIHQSDLAALQEAFGSLRFVHLRRSDEIGQAVSWTRAEQTGYWQEGDSVQGPAEPDVTRMVQLVRTIRQHNASWRSWFAQNGIEPHHLDYEDLTQRPDVALREIAALVGLSAPLIWKVEGLPARQADRMNAKWSALLRDAMEEG
ncbi:hypothetical protein DJ010_17780 [Nocardioides silvaticus]|uniref:Trehalose 2-sulfotransferase n=1 Tax=Nocardioides silvaticus TaxID=2201891 RepID=A0A316TD13_9ACTN|nr:Stf0 family sulfotransferase [Nocardioides silvaticus]PWN01411.1 hypothetical protein DJ010_17780 [Nocardioides silvaticus]